MQHAKFEIDDVEHEYHLSTLSKSPVTFEEGCTKYGCAIKKTSPLNVQLGDVTVQYVSSSYTWCIMASSNGNSFPVTGHLCGEFTGNRWIPSQRPVTRSFDVFFDLCLNKRLSNTRDAGDLRRHCSHYDVIVMEDFLSCYSKRLQTNQALVLRLHCMES